MQENTLLRLKGITKRFGAFIAVDDVSFDVQAGTCTGLLGSNGAGKTTILSILTGLFPPNEGLIVLENYEFTVMPVVVKKYFGYVPDSQEVLSSLTGLEYLDFICQIYQLSTDQSARVYEYLKLFQMEEKAKQLMDTYSHGQRKKMQLIAALAHMPRLMIMDEPFSGLDPEMIAITKVLLRKLRERGMAILLSTHDLMMAEGLCDTLIFLHHGKVVTHGTVSKVLEQYNARTIEEAFLQAIGIEGYENAIDNILACL